MIVRISTLVVFGGLTLGLAACGGGNNATTTQPPVTPPTPTATAESKFGTCFATRFDAPANSKATDPVPCPDLPPVSPTTKPVPL